jgi:hypothetical protein
MVMEIAFREGCYGTMDLGREGNFLFIVGPFTQNLGSFAVVLFCFLQYWGLNSRPHSCYAGSLPLEPYPTPKFSILSHIKVLNFQLKVVFFFFLGNVIE